MDCGFGTLDLERQQEEPVTDPLPTEKPEMLQLSPVTGLDGAFDETDAKPLPWSPADERPRSIMQDELERMFAVDGLEQYGDNSGVSVSSSGLSQVKTQDNIRSIVSGTTTGPQELSPIEKALRYRFSSTSSHSAPSSYAWLPLQIERN